MAHVLACARVPVASVASLIPPQFLESLEQNQQIASCCRHPENHDIEAWFSNEAEAANGVPDIYIFKCTQVHPNSIRPNGERWHPRFMVGSGERPIWEVR